MLIKKTFERADFNDDRMKQILAEAKSNAMNDFKERQSPKPILITHLSMNRVNTFNYRISQESENPMVKAQKQLNYNQMKNIQEILLKMENSIQLIVKN